MVVRRGISVVSTSGRRLGVGVIATVSVALMDV